MVVLVLTLCPAGLRGFLTRWLLEITPGVFVGVVPARVRDHIWRRVEEMVKDGRAILIYGVRGEQRLGFKVLRHDWKPREFDGVWLIERPTQITDSSSLRSGWSSVGRLRRVRRLKPK